MRKDEHCLQYADRSRVKATEAERRFAAWLAENPKLKADEVARNNARLRIALDVQSEFG